MERIRNIIHGDHDPYKGYEPIDGDFQGWSSASPVFGYCIDEIKPKLIIEIGTWKGCSAINMGQTCLNLYNDFEIVCIDTFLGSWELWTTMSEFLPYHMRKNGRPHVYDQFLSNVMHTGLKDYITPFPIDSVNGALCLKEWNIQADMIYIDAGHDYDSVVTDLRLYKDLVRPGGYIIGDDWFHEPIKQAVSEVLGKVTKSTHDKFIWVRPK